MGDFKLHNGARLLSVLLDFVDYVFDVQPKVQDNITSKRIVICR